MSLYYYLASKDDLLDGIADAVVAEINDVVGTIDVPSAGASWKTAARRRILSAREVKLRILGCDMAGQVEAVGPDVTEFRPGDDVFALLAQGGFAEYVSVPERLLPGDGRPLPEALNRRSAVQRDDLLGLAGPVHEGRQILPGLPGQPPVFVHAGR